MKNLVFYLFICVLSLQNISAQTTRGLGMPAGEKIKPIGKTYALIIGISKYQSPGIPSLQYSDKDAYVFYEYLKSVGVDTNDMILLLNGNAKSSEFWADVNYFMDIAQPGDKLYFYFSGHGDVESKTITKDAYLLPYDAPKVTYASGAISIYLLKGYLATLSSNGVQVVFISDACHAGNLSGGRAGMDATEAVLKDQWQDEIKILSCQPGELSLEGKQWGGGRGLFSYELINGLAGKADKNKDGKVSLRELNLYLTDKVPDGASPMAQNPVVEGKPETVLSTDNEKVLQSINNTGSSDILSLVDIKGFDDVLLKNAGAAVKSNYIMFKACMDSANYAAYSDEQLDKYVFGQPADDIQILPSALYYLKQIPLTDSTRILLAYMRRNLAAALMEELSDSSANAAKKALSGANGQLVIKQINNYIKGVQLKSIALSQLLGWDKFRKSPIYSRLVFSNVYDASQAEDSAHFNLKFNQALLDTALIYDPNNARLYFLQGFLMMKYTSSKDAIVQFKKALQVSPKFTAIYPMMALCFKDLNQMDSVVYYSRLGLEGETDNPFATRMGYIALLAQLDEKDSLNVYLQTIENYLPPDATRELLANVSGLLAKIALQAHLTDQVIRLANNIKDDDAGMFVMSKYLLLAAAYSEKGNKEIALKYLKTGLEKGYNYYDRIKANTSFDNIRKEPEFIALMKKYFPNDYKE